MSGGRIAISGFDYQAIVILDLLFDHFDLHGAQARPEGSDDLDLVWSENGRVRRRHVQVKKPRETEAGVPTGRAWRLSEVANELLPNTVGQLATSDNQQTWIVGDRVQPEVRRLVDAANAAPARETSLYWSVIHLMARAAILDQLPTRHRRSLLRWRYQNPVNLAAEARDRLMAAYGQVLSAATARPELVRAYQERVVWLHERLPGVLARIQILDDYGSEAAVGQRFKDRLQCEYLLPSKVVEDALFGNFRSYINDVAKRPDEMIDRRGFEVQLRSAWPQMSAATEPPIPPISRVLRPDLTDELVKSGAALVTEVVGISGSGKTTLAGDAAAALQDHDPGRLPVYVRVRSEASFRDVMSGVAFYLLRRGTPDLFGLAVESRTAADTVIDRLAEVCGGLSRPVQLLLDLVDGSCSAQFGQDLARFARGLTAGSCRLVVFGQQSSFSALSPVESIGAGVRMINMRGFHWEEFVKLVGHYHGEADRAVLSEVYGRVTVGRPAGLHAQLAEALARQPSLDSMLSVAASPPDDMVSAAEQNRFAQLASGARSAAEHLVCFALPFRQSDAEAIFPNENVGGAIKALSNLGLLRMEAEGLLEMHETVRAGLESGIALAVRQNAHGALAEWYGQRGDLPAQIFHLDKAGRSADAERLGRETFLRGEGWRNLASFVTSRAVVTVQNVVDLVARPGRIADFYLLRSIIAGLASDGVDALLMELLSKQCTRYFSDHDWARPVVEAILALNPASLQNLLEFTILQAADNTQRRNGLTWLLIAARHQRPSSAPWIVAFARTQPEDVQRLLLPALLLDGGRAALGLAFEIFARPTDDQTARDAPWSSVKLTIERREDALEFLAALAQPPAAEMIATRSLGFGSVGSLIWAARIQLRPFCSAILGSDGDPAEVKAAAWRTLIFIGHPTLEALVDPLAPGLVSLDYALLGPAFAPTAYDVERYERIVLDPLEPAPRRQGSLTVLLFLNVDLGPLRRRLAALPQDPLAAVWDRLFVLLFVKQPFVDGVPMIQAELAASSKDPLPPSFLASCLDAVAETAWPEVTDLLEQGLQHSDVSLRRISASGLARRRSYGAAKIIRRQFAIESDPNAIVLLAHAIAGCGPSSASDLQCGRASSDLDLWRCIVAMRTRDESYAPELIRLATDTSVHWMVRRAAIWAAGRLPFAAALQQIGPSILAANTPLTIDRNDNLQAHASLGWLLQTGVSQFMPRGESAFIAFVGAILEQQWSELAAGGDLLPASAAATWLYKSLAVDPSPAGIKRLQNELRTPLLQAAVVRSFRLCGRSRDIETVLASASSVWLAVKCLQERRWVRDPDPDLCPRLREALRKSSCGGAPLLGRIVDEIEAGRRLAESMASAPTSSDPPELQAASASSTNPLIDYSAAVRALRGADDLGVDTRLPIALNSLSREEAQKLIALADPANDRSTAIVRFTPGMTFTSAGHLVGRESSTSNGGKSLPEQLRPTIAAANRFDLPMPWHGERLRWPLIGAYAPQFIASLGAQGDADRLYQALESDGDVLLPFLGSLDGIEATKLLIDERLAPVLHRYLLLGDDAFFESLCNLAQRIPSTSAVPILSGLLGRWAARFDIASQQLQPDSTALWRGFARLREHPRFREVGGWRKTLDNVLAANIRWFHKQDIMRILEADPGSYVTIENRLARKENWVHFNRSEIDSLDDAAERLFHLTH